MSRFIQIHALTSYPPSNPNRDDQGRPKTAIVGGAQRLRISSQALKRAMRQSSAFQMNLAGHLGDRTRKIGDVVMKALIEKGHAEETARGAAAKVAEFFGKVNKAAEGEVQTVETNQLVFVSPEEKEKAVDLAEKIIDGSLKADTKKNAKDKEKVDREVQKLVLNATDRAADIAMFGRMLADAPAFNRDGAVQVSQAITTHAAVVEDDFFSAVDDLQTKEDAAGSGAGMIGEQGFGSGVYYVYVNIDLDMLRHNLGPEDDGTVAKKAVEALVEAVATACPTGKQNTFANRPRASFMRVETGDVQPRDLSGAFYSPIKGEDPLTRSIAALRATAAKIDKAYGACAANVVEMDVMAEQGSLDALKAAAVAAFDEAS